MKKITPTKIVQQHCQKLSQALELLEHVLHVQDLTSCRDFVIIISGALTVIH